AGAETKLAYGGTFDGGGANRRADLTAGHGVNDGRTNLFFSASYSTTNDLMAADRGFIQRGHERYLANNPNPLINSVPLLGATTTITSTGVFNPATGTVVRPNLTLKTAITGGTTPVSLGSPITFVPDGYAGPASDHGQGLIANAGNYNLELAD